MRLTIFSLTLLLTLTVPSLFAKAPQAPETATDAYVELTEASRPLRPRRVRAADIRFHLEVKAAEQKNASKLLAKYGALALAGGLAAHQIGHAFNHTTHGLNWLEMVGSVPLVFGTIGLLSAGGLYLWSHYTAFKAEHYAAEEKAEESEQ